jgi:hypothetical protein
LANPQLAELKPDILDDAIGAAITTSVPTTRRRGQMLGRAIPD